MSVWAAYGEAQQAVQLADEFHSSSFGPYREAFLPYATEPLLALGEVERLTDLVSGPREAGSAPQVGRTRAEGHLAMARNDNDAATDSFEQAISVADEFDRLLEAVLGRIDLARVLDPSDERLRSVVTKARADAQRLGASRLLDRLDEIEGIDPVEAAQA